MKDTTLENYLRSLIKPIIDLNDQQEINFIESTHEYFINGVKFDSVTTLLQPIYANKFKDIPLSILMDKAQIGTMVHAFLEHLYYNQLDFDEAWDWFNRFDPNHFWKAEYLNKVLPYLKAAQKWMMEKDYILLAAELKILDLEKLISGTTDFLFYDQIRRVFGIGDYKTSAKIDLKTQALQLAGYCLKINKILGYNLFTHGLLVQLKADGTYQEYWVDLYAKGVNGLSYVDRYNLLEANYIINIRQEVYVPRS